MTPLPPLPVAATARSDRSPWGVALAVLLAIGLPSGARAECSTDASELTLQSARVLSFVNAGGNKLDATIAVTVANAGEGAFAAPSATLTAVAGGYGATIVDDSASCPDLGALEVAECSDSVVVRISRTRRAAFEAAVLANFPAETTLTFGDVTATEVPAYQPSVLELDALTLARITAYGEDGGGTWVRFRGHTAVIDAVATGSVLVSTPTDPCASVYDEGVDTPYAWLAGSVAYTNFGLANQTTTVYYTPAGLGDVYESAHFLLSMEARALDSLPLPDGVTPLDPGAVGFNDLLLAGGSADLDGSATVLSALYDLDARIRHGDMDSSTEILSVEQSVTLSVTAGADAVVADGPVAIGSVQVDYGTLWLGAVPLPFTVDLDLSVGLSGSVSGGTLSSAVYDGTIQTAIDWEPGAGAIAATTLLAAPFLYSPPAVSEVTTSDLYAWVSTAVGVDADGAGGSQVDVSTWLQTAIDPGETPWWTYSAGWATTATEGLALAGLAADAGDAGSWEEEVFSAGAAAALQARLAELAAANAAGQDIRWSRAFDFADGADTYGYAADLLPGGDAVLAVGRDGRFAAARITPGGDPIWARIYQRTDWQPMRVRGLHDGHVLVAGQTSLTGGQLFLTSLNGDGTAAWTRTLDLGATAHLEAMVPYGDPPGPNSGVILLGRLESGEGSGFAIRLDSTGSLVWARRYAMASAVEVHDAWLTPSGLVVAGSTDAAVPGVDSGPNGLLFALDSTGNPTWARVIGGAFGDSLHAVVGLPSGEFLATGQLGTDGVATASGLWLLRVDAGGEVVGHLTLSELDPGPGNGATPDDIGLRMLATDSGVTVLATTGTGLDRGAWVVTLGLDGRPHRLAVFDGPAADRLSSVVDTGDGYLMAGRTDSFGAVGPGSVLEAWVVRTGYDGALDFYPETDARNDLLPFRLEVPPEQYLGAPHHGDQAVTVDAFSLSVSAASITLGSSAASPDLTVLAP